jgi:hypothetical protein
MLPNSGVPSDIWRLDIGPYTRVYTFIHVYAPSDTHVHLRTRVCTFRHVCAPSDTYVHLQIRVCTFRTVSTHSDTYVHLQIRVYTFRHVCTHSDTCVRPLPPVCVPLDIHRQRYCAGTPNAHDTLLVHHTYHNAHAQYRLPFCLGFRYVSSTNLRIRQSNTDEQDIYEC